MQKEAERKEMGQVLVFGHRSPDNDSICSAIAYAHLKNLIDPANVYIAARLGAVPPESEWVLRRFGVAAPIEISHVRTRVRDVMTADVLTVAPDDTLRTVGALLGERGVRALPVVEDGQVCGLVTVQALAGRYVENVGASGFTGRAVRVGRLVEALDGELLVGDPEGELAGGVLIGAMEPETMVAAIVSGDTVVLGDRKRSQPLAIKAGAACVVVTGGASPAPDVVDLARERGCVVISTPHDAYAAARLLDLAHAVSEIMETDVLVVEPDALLSEASEDLFASPHREAPVVDASGRLVGLLTRTGVARATRRRVILVDHNEIAQSADGVEDASVVEIVDHHRVGDVQTAAPIAFIGRPVGATATIVAGQYRDVDVDPPAAMAGLLLAAVLTDTVALKSPTTTDTDRETVDWLAGLIDADPVEFALEIFRARSSGAAFSAEDVVTRDLKEYRVGESRVGVAQVETVDADDILEHRAELVASMEATAAQRGFDTLVLMVTDVVREGSELLVAGKRRPVEKAFGVSFTDGSAWFDGMLSRKKQVAPRLVDSAGR
jgi:manganese-dependent inorganic pyrophosphatase